MNLWCMLDSLPVWYSYRESRVETPHLSATTPLPDIGKVRTFYHILRVKIVFCLVVKTNVSPFVQNYCAKCLLLFLRKNCECQKRSFDEKVTW